MPERPIYTLLLFIQPRSTVPLPAAFDAAARLFEEARVDYEQRHRYPEAARLFLEAARVLVPVEGFHASVAMANRRSCYRNARAAFSAARDRTGGGAALAAAAEADPAWADAIHELARELQRAREPQNER